MTVPFSLAGLLRLRRLEEEQAGAVYGAATARHAALVARTDRAIADAAAMRAEVDTIHELQAVAAARAASMAMLAELHALTAGADDERVAAQRGYTTARGRTLGLEKLEDRHAETVHAAQLAAEQVVLDELGSTAHTRRRREEAL
jgi:flagellar FliJ protein